MVKKVIKKWKKFFQCEECGFYYKPRKMAQKCESWCKEHHSCNIEITKHAIQLE